jgi:NADPH:quinone reductase-like Zn-dependent oxidoreductase
MTQHMQRDKLGVPPAGPPAGRTMRAVVQDRYGPAPEDILRLAEVDRPTFGDDEVLVRVRAASVDRGTWHIMSPRSRRTSPSSRRPPFPSPG